MRGRRARTGGKGGRHTDDRSSSRHRESDREKRSSPAPRPKGARRRRNSLSYSSGGVSALEEENGSELLNEIGASNDEVPDEFPFLPDCGVACMRHPNKFEEEPMSDLRSLYTHFPKDRLRLLSLHIFFTVFFYVLVFPAVNCVWSYFIDVDSEIMHLFTFITEDQSSNLSNHLKHLKWLTFPGFNAECMSLLIAIIMKEFLTIHWEGFLENEAFAEGIIGTLAKRYRR